MFKYLLNSADLEIILMDVDAMDRQSEHRDNDISISAPRYPLG